MPNVTTQKRIIRRAAARHHINPAILWGLYGAESNFGHNHNNSSAGAQGPFQFMPSTAASYGIDPHNFKQAANAAAKYLSTYRDRGEAGMLAAYNAGPAGNPNNPETRAYVPKVQQLAKTWDGAKVRPNSSPGNLDAPSTNPSTVGYSTDGPSKQQALLGYLANRGKPKALLELKANLNAASSVAPQSAPAKQSSVKVALPDKAQDVMAEAQLINAAQVPYQWGGGHQKKLLRGSKVTALDCSGAVSRVLGLDPRVASQFKSWGKPGKGRITVYAKDTHVLMSIRDKKGVEHFFGTSSTNPGGGPGWIKRSQLSDSYLAGFVARHQPGL